MVLRNGQCTSSCLFGKKQIFQSHFIKENSVCLIFGLVIWVSTVTDGILLLQYFSGFDKAGLVCCLVTRVSTRVSTESFFYVYLFFICLFIHLFIFLFLLCSRNSVVLFDTQGISRCRDSLFLASL